LARVYFEGNVRTADSTVFHADNNATVYYLPATTGRSSIFAGRPAVLWNPLIQVSDASFGPRNNQLGFNITVKANIPIVVQACTDLTSSGWTALQTLVLTNGLIYFSDPAQTRNLGRYYRISSS
jgi:hypothetical protein